MTDRMFQADSELSLEPSRSGYPAVPAVWRPPVNNAITGSVVPAPSPGLLSQNLPKELLGLNFKQLPSGSLFVWPSRQAGRLAGLSALV